MQGLSAFRMQFQEAKGAVQGQSPDLLPMCFKTMIWRPPPLQWCLVFGWSSWAQDPQISKPLAIPAWKVEEGRSWWRNSDVGNNYCEKGFDICSQDLMWNIIAAVGLLGDCKQACLLMAIVKRQCIFHLGVSTMFLHKWASLDTHIFHNIEVS